MSNPATNRCHEQQGITDEVSFELADLLPFEPTPTPRDINGVVIGRVVGLSDSGDPLVDYPQNLAGRPVPAQTLAELQTTDMGRQAALMFAGGDPRRPILMGLIHQPGFVERKDTAAAAPHAQLPVINVETREERIELTAEREIVLQCGKASITLTKAGKVLIRGTYVLSRSSGVNAVKGGSVELN